MKVLKLSAHGVPQSWISLEQAVIHSAAGDVRWVAGSEVAVFHGGHNAVTGLQSIIVVHSIMGTRGVSRINPFDLKPGLANDKLFARDRNVCAYCGAHFDEHVLTREHIVPQAQRGADHWMNVVTACRLSPPKTLPVECVSELRALKGRAACGFGTRSRHQFGLRVRGRAR